MCFQGCCHAPAHDIRVTDLWCRGTAAVENGCLHENCTIDPQTTHMVPTSGAWPAEAQAIIDAAGATETVRPHASHLL